MSSFPIVVYALEEPGYDIINLTCIATKPSGVLPPIVFAWSKCGSPVGSDPRVSITTWQVSTITSMSNMLLYGASVQDSSVYECKAMMNFPDLSSVTSNRTFQVSVAGTYIVTSVVIVSFVTTVLVYMYTSERHNVRSATMPVFQ